MRGFLALLKMNTLMQLRNKSALFWHFVFPVIFVFLFGFILGKQATNINIGITNDNPQLKKAFTAAFKSSSEIKIISDSKNKLIGKLKKGDLDIIVASGASQPGKPVDVELFYDPSDTMVSNIANNLAVSVLNEIRLSAYKVPQMFEVKKKSITVEGLNYISFLMPGVIGMSIMFSSLMGTAYAIVVEREKAILRRLRLTLMKPVSYIAAKALGMVAISFLQALVIIAVAVAVFNVKIIGNFANIAFIIMLGCLMMVSLGFFIAAIAKTMQSVDTISNIVSMPMMFLAGTFFPIDGAPSWLQSFSKVLPLTYLNDSLRAVIVKGESLVDVGPAILIMLAWTGVFISIAAYFFKWETPNSTSKSLFGV